MCSEIVTGKCVYAGKKSCAAPEDVKAEAVVDNIDL